MIPFDKQLGLRASGASAPRIKFDIRMKRDDLLEPKEIEKDSAPEANSN